MSDAHDDEPDGLPAEADAESGSDHGVTRRRLIGGAGAAALTMGSAALGASAATASGPPPGTPPPAGSPPPMDGPTPAQPTSAPLTDAGPYLTTNQGQRIADDQNTLKAGARGPALLEDFHFREKITHFDHERIPERVVHARGAGAHGVFRLTKSLAQFTRAAVLSQVGVATPTFVRFSTVNGSRGSADTVRDARGFATKFYTSEGVWDIVGNNIPVFFIQDAIKFPDLVHAFKPEPHDEIPQASTAHDTFWDFISLTPESMHMVMWVMSDRALPRSFRMMEGFGVNTFRLVNTNGNSTFVKFHWKPALGVHSLVWDEAHRLAGIDPDFNRRDLWQAIETGAGPEFDLGVQLLAESDAAKVGFDVLDATKLWPENIVPVQIVGRMTLNRNPDNFFAETEQVAFHTGHVVPGIDFSDDPLLQGRNFSYLDTQLNRFGTPNFSQLPINQPRSDVNNYQQDGFMRYHNRPGQVNFEPSSLPGANAAEAPPAAGGFVSYAEPVTGTKIRQRSASFSDHYSQATLFWNSVTDWERQHIVQALQFELGKVATQAIQQRMLGHLANINGDLATGVASALGLTAPAGQPNTSIGRAINLSEAPPAPSIATRTVAILTADGVDGGDVTRMQADIAAEGGITNIIAPHLNAVSTKQGGKVDATGTYLTTDSVMYDAVYVPGGAASVATLQTIGDAIHFVEEAFKHYKPIAATGAGRGLLGSALPRDAGAQPGIVTGPSAGAISGAFIRAIAQHRFYDRTAASSISA
jgi:catalase